MAITTAADIPRERIHLMCAALIRPGSSLDNRIWDDAGRPRRHTPTWAIYELDRCFFPAHELRFGDGSGMSIEEIDLRDLILIESIGDAQLSEIFQ